jgi:Sec-independent protein translocase protein TatA
MPGFFDQITNLTPEQNQGLLGLATQLLQASGPSRTPISFGQALGAGLQGFQSSMDQAQQRKMQQQAFGLDQQLKNLQLQGAMGEQQDRQTAREQQLAAQRVAREYNNSLASPTAAAQGVLGSNMAPTIDNAERLAAAPRLGQQPALDEYSRRIGLADALRAQGLFAQADAQEVAALKFKPEFDQKPQFATGPDGKPFAYVLDKGGNQKRLDGVLPRDEMKLADVGGKLVPYNPYQLTPNQSFTKTLSPDAAASNAVARDRLAFDKSQAGKPVYNADAGGFVLPPSPMFPAGRVIPLMGSGKKMTEDQGKATGWLVQAQNAFENLKSVGLDEKGAPTSAARPGILDSIGNIPGLDGIANSFRSADRQKFIQAASSLSEALLRAATGAGYNREEGLQKIREITPIFGEDPSVTQQKIAAIPLYIESLRVRAGPGADKASEVLAGRSNLDAASAAGGAAQKPRSKIIKLDGGGSAMATLGGDGNYYVQRNGKNYRVEEN